jgi:hypothetical protein
MRESRPSRVRIDDWDNPRFPPEMEQLRASMAPLAAPLRLETEVLLADAAAQTGLDDFGNSEFEERLGVILSALREEAGLSPFGVLSWYTMVRQLLQNRLLLQDLLKRHPEIHEERIERPIFIVGLPRTGTTHLHNLMSADPGLRSLPYWESLEPVPATIPPPDPDPRFERAAMATGFTEVAMPYFKAMHEMTPEHVHEEVQLQTLTFATMLLETQWHVPSYRDWFKATDQTPSYAYLRRVLQALQWLRGGERWVLKSPQHLEQFRPLTTVFPDATVVCTHREPIAVTASFVTMVSYSARLSIEHPDPASIARYWSERIQDMLSACVRDRELLAPERSMDLRFNDFMADDWGAVEQIYALADQPLPDSSRDAIQAYLDGHGRGRHGRIRYDLASFGINLAEREAGLAGYRERFGV